MKYLYKWTCQIADYIAGTDTKINWNWNFRAWSSKNPHALHEKFLQPQQIGVKCVLFCGCITGPIFFENRVESKV